MSDQNADLDELVIAVQAVCEKVRATAKGSPPNRATATALRNTFNRVCPRLCQKFQNASDDIYARRIIDFGVAGQNDPVQEKIWQEYYKSGSTLAEIENLINYASRTARRLIGVFAYRVAVQLLEKELEITDPIQGHTETVDQRARRTLQDAFDLSNKQAEILFAFCRHPELSQGEICGRILFIAENTLKVHKRRILHQMGCRSMNEAVNKALKVLRETLGNDWDKV